MSEMDDTLTNNTARASFMNVSAIISSKKCVGSNHNSVQSECGKYQKIICGILSVPQKNVLILNHVMIILYFVFEFICNTFMSPFDYAMMCHNCMEEKKPIRSKHLDLIGAYIYIYIK